MNLHSSSICAQPALPDALMLRVSNVSAVLRPCLFLLYRITRQPCQWLCHPAAAMGHDRCYAMTRPPCCNNIVATHSRGECRQCHGVNCQRGCRERDGICDMYDPVCYSVKHHTRFVHRQFAHGWGAATAVAAALGRVGWCTAGCVPGKGQWQAPQGFGPCSVLIFIRATVCFSCSSSKIV